MTRDEIKEKVEDLIYKYFITGKIFYEMGRKGYSLRKLADVLGMSMPCLKRKLTDGVSIDMRHIFAIYGYLGLGINNDLGNALHNESGILWLQIYCSRALWRDSYKDGQKARKAA